MTLFDPPPPVCPICKGKGRVYDPKIDAERMCVCRSEKLPPPDTNPAGPAGIEEPADIIRLNHQQAAVWAVMQDGEWHTLREIARRTNYPEASVSARFRDLRKQKYGAHTVERQSVGGGLFMYRLVPNEHALVIAS